MILVYDHVSIEGNPDAKFFGGTRAGGRDTNLLIPYMLPFDHDMRVYGVALTIFNTTIAEETHVKRLKDGTIERSYKGAFNACDTSKAALKIWNGNEEVYVKAGSRIPPAPALEDLWDGQIDIADIWSIGAPITLKKGQEFGAAFGHLEWRQANTACAFTLVLVGEKA